MEIQLNDLTDELESGMKGIVAKLTCGWLDRLNKQS